MVASIFLQFFVHAAVQADGVLEFALIVVKIVWMLVISVPPRTGTKLKNKQALKLGDCLPN